MNNFKQKIIRIFDLKGITFPGLDKEVIINKVLSSAEEYVISNIAADLLSKDDRDLFRDAFLCAPDIFDADEFLAERITDYDMQVDIYFDKWLKTFNNSL